MRLPFCLSCRLGPLSPVMILPSARCGGTFTVSTRHGHGRRAMARNTIAREEAVRLALAELGDVGSQELAAFIENRYKLRIEPRFIPIYKASLKAREEL